MKCGQFGHLALTLPIEAMYANDFTTDDYIADDDRGMSWGWFALCVVLLYLMWVA